MNLYILYSPDCFTTCKFPRVKELVKINHSSDPGLQEINDLLNSIFKWVPISREFFLNGRARLIDYGWDMIYYDRNYLENQFIMIIDLEHSNMSQYNRHLKIGQILKHGND